MVLEFILLLGGTLSAITLAHKGLFQTTAQQSKREPYETDFAPPPVTQDDPSKKVAMQKVRWKLFKGNGMPCMDCKGKGYRMYLQCHVVDDEYWDECMECEGSGKAIQHQLDV